MYKAKSLLLEQHDGTRLLAVGTNAWPLPLPIIEFDDKWYLDGGAGAEEALCRRIGHNELGAIAVCSNFIKAQKAYAAEGRDGNPPGNFAARLTSERGKQNGLYWPTADDELPSPSAMPVGGMLTGGIALLGWPADYRDSGLMSFIVNQWGLFFERDLGADTAAMTAAILCFDSDRSGSVVTCQPFP